jgi:hypothetical protein
MGQEPKRDLDRISESGYASFDPMKSQFLDCRQLRQLARVGFKILVDEYRIAELPGSSL